jgi:hypothetical protein
MVIIYHCWSHNKRSANLDHDLHILHSVCAYFTCYNEQNITLCNKGYIAFGNLSGLMGKDLKLLGFQRTYIP